jgi:hypothetical protein
MESLRFLKLIFLFALPFYIHSYCIQCDFNYLHLITRFILTTYIYIYIDNIYIYIYIYMYILKTISYTKIIITRDDKQQNFSNT